jgi:hypothetical protein
MIKFRLSSGLILALFSLLEEVAESFGLKGRKENFYRMA